MLVKSTTTTITIIHFQRCEVNVLPTEPIDEPDAENLPAEIPIEASGELKASGKTEEVRNL